MPEGKWIEGLTPEMPVADAARVVLAARFEVVREYLPLAAERPSDDSEHVHQLRVGTRRAGAALRVFAQYVPKKYRQAAKGYLRAIRRAAGDARDWDVLLETLPAARSLRTIAGKPALDFLLGYALGERTAAQTRLVRAAAEIGAGFAAAVAALPQRIREPDATAPRTFATLAAAHLGPLLKDFTAAVRADPSESPELHQLRILGKRTRYAMEVFAGCFAAPFRETLYPAVEQLQELLGGLQDAVVGVQWLEGLKERAEKLVPGEWPRWRRGVAGMVRAWRVRLPAVREDFQKWRGEWAELVRAHPLEPRRLAPAPG